MIAISTAIAAIGGTVLLISCCCVLCHSKTCNEKGSDGKNVWDILEDGVDRIGASEMHDGEVRINYDKYDHASRDRKERQYNYVNEQRQKKREDEERLEGQEFFKRSLYNDDIVISNQPKHSKLFTLNSSFNNTQVDQLDTIKSLLNNNTNAVNEISELDSSIKNFNLGPKYSVNNKIDKSSTPKVFTVPVGSIKLDKLNVQNV